VIKDIEKQALSKADEKNGRIRTLVTAAEILEKLASLPPPVRVNQLARELGMTRSRISRHLLTLLELGFIERIESVDGYRLGWKIFQLGQSAASHHTIVEVGLNYISKLRDSIQQTVLLVVPNEKDGMVLATSMAQQGVVVALQPGSVLPFPTSPSARVMLAFSSQENQERTMSIHFAQGGQEFKTLEEKLTRIRDRFFEVGDGSRQGVRAIAAPVFDAHNVISGAISVLLFQSATNDEGRLHDIPVTEVLACAEKMSRTLGSTRFFDH
jgi:DNA-binding IclR family transcriptional regulator